LPIHRDGFPNSIRSHWQLQKPGADGVKESVGYHRAHTDNDRFTADLGWMSAAPA